MCSKAVGLCCCGVAEEKSNVWDSQGLALQLYPLHPHAQMSSHAAKVFIFRCVFTTDRCAPRVLGSAHKLGGTELWFFRAVFGCLQINTSRAPVLQALSRTTQAGFALNEPLFRTHLILMLQLSWCDAADKRGNHFFLCPRLFCSCAGFGPAFFLWSLVKPGPCGWGDMPVTFSVRQEVYPACVSSRLQDQVQSAMLASYFLLILALITMALDGHILHCLRDSFFTASKL